VLPAAEGAGIERRGRCGRSKGNSKHPIGVSNTCCPLKFIKTQSERGEARSSGIPARSVREHREDFPDAGVHICHLIELGTLITGDMPIGAVVPIRQLQMTAETAADKENPLFTHGNRHPEQVQFITSVQALL